MRPEEMLSSLIEKAKEEKMLSIDLQELSASECSLTKIVNQISEKKILLEKLRLIANANNLEDNLSAIEELLGLQRSSLTTVDISNSEFSTLNPTYNVSFFMSLFQSSALKNVYLNRVGIDIAQIKIMQSIFCRLQAEEFSLENNQFPPEEVATFFQIIKPEKLKKFYFSHNSLNEKTVQSFANFLQKISCLEFLRLNQCDLKTEDLKKIVEAIGKNGTTNLVECDLGNNKFDVKSVDMILDLLKKSPKIISLNLSDSFSTETLLYFQKRYLAVPQLPDAGVKKYLMEKWFLEIQSSNHPLVMMIAYCEALLELQPYREEAMIKKGIAIRELKKTLRQQQFSALEEAEEIEEKCAFLEKPIPTVAQICSVLREFYTSEKNFLMEMRNVQKEIDGLVEPVLVWKVHEAWGNIIRLQWVWGKLDPIQVENVSLHIQSLCETLSSTKFSDYYADLSHHSENAAEVRDKLEYIQKTVMKNPDAPHNSEAIYKRECYQALIKQWIITKGTLAMPGQRIARYELLLRELLKAVEKSSVDHLKSSLEAQLKNALESLQKCAQPHKINGKVSLFRQVSSCSEFRSHPSITVSSSSVFKQTGPSEQAKNNNTRGFLIGVKPPPPQTTETTSVSQTLT